MNSPDKDNPSNEKSSETSETVSSISSIESIDEFYKATGIELSRSHANERLVARTLAHTLRVEVEIRYSSDHGGGSAPFFWVGPGNQGEPSDGGIVDDLAICSLKTETHSETVFRKIPLEEIFPGGFPAKTSFTRTVRMNPVGADVPNGIYMFNFQGKTARIGWGLMTIGLTYRVILDGTDNRELPYPIPPTGERGNPWKLLPCWTRNANGSVIVEVG